MEFLKRRETITDIEKIKHRLINTDDKFVDIARDFNKSSKTIQNINNGFTHKKPDEVYPLRMSGQRLGTLKERLSIPNINAVPRPHVLSPQMLDYIGFLSLLGVEIDCLLTFKEVYIKELNSYFDKELSDSEIVSIISLKPRLPQSLDELIKAHSKPRVQLMNLEFWIKTGIIQESERTFITEMLLK